MITIDIIDAAIKALRPAAIVFTHCEINYLLMSTTVQET